MFLPKSANTGKVVLTMHTSLYTVIRIRVSARPAATGEQVLSAETRERERKLQTELVLWEQQVKKEAQLEACRGKGTLAFGGVESQLRRISEQVTHEAQEKKRSIRNQIQL